MKYNELENEVKLGVKVNAKTDGYNVTSASIKEMDGYYISVAMAKWTGYYNDAMVSVKVMYNGEGEDYSDIIEHVIASMFTRDFCKEVEDYCKPKKDDDGKGN